MPELPEVETIRRQLDARLIGRSVSSVETRWHKSFTGRRVDPGVVVGRPVARVWRRGKVLGIDTDGGISLLTHLRMTGQLLLEPVGTPRDTLSTRGTPSPRDTSATRVVFGFDDGSRLFFNDQRKFGRLVVLPTADVPADPLLARMGPEPLEPGFDAEALGAGLARHPSMTLKAALLDQGVVAGIGNIYADEALWRAGLHPQRRCGAPPSRPCGTGSSPCCPTAWPAAARHCATTWTPRADRAATSTSPPSTAGPGNRVGGAQRSS